jgi:hypothetical protein
MPAKKIEQRLPKPVVVSAPPTVLQRHPTRWMILTTIFRFRRGIYETKI